MERGRKRGRDVSLKKYVEIVGRETEEGRKEGRKEGKNEWRKAIVGWEGEGR